MREIWFADHQDLPKWGVVDVLVRVHDIAQVNHVAFFRTSPRPNLRVDSAIHEMPANVWDFFRNVGSIAGETIDLPVVFFDRLFTRATGCAGYVESALQWLVGQPRPRLLLLDPDTGLEPASGAKLEHVTQNEVRKFWNALEPGEVLALYQHRDRTADWLSAKCRQLASALGVELRRVQIGHAEVEQPNAAILYIEKTRADQQTCSAQ